MDATGGSEGDGDVIKPIVTNKDIGFGGAIEVLHDGLIGDAAIGAAFAARGVSRVVDKLEVGAQPSPSPFFFATFSTDKRRSP